MPFATTHVLVPIIIIDLIRDHYKKLKKKITIHDIFFAGIFGLLPDIDIPIGWLLAGFSGNAAYSYHRIFTHTLMLPLIFLIIAWATHGKKRRFFVIAAFGWATHVMLDFFVGGLVYPLYPLSAFAAGLGLLITNETHPETAAGIMAGIDAIILLLWLWHEEKLHKIKDFV